MPSSYVHAVPKIVEAIDASGWPASVYDVGIGWGKYGFLIREYFDAYRREIQIDGCEIFPKYIAHGPAKHIYDRIQLGNWLELTPPRLRYDLCLLVDVLEHFTEEDGVKALQKARRYSDRTLVSTPLGYPQGEMMGNPHEAHLSEWPLWKFREHGFEVTDIGSCERSVIAWVYERR